MRSAYIDSGTKSLVVKKIFRSRVVAGWNSISEVKLSRLPSLVDEIGMILVTPADVFFVRETQAGYWDLFKSLGLESELPVDWYSKVEEGTVFTVAVSEMGRVTKI